MIPQAFPQFHAAKAYPFLRKRRAGARCAGVAAADARLSTQNRVRKSTPRCRASVCTYPILRRRGPLAPERRTQFCAARVGGLRLDWAYPFLRCTQFCESSVEAAQRAKAYPFLRESCVPATRRSALRAPAKRTYFCERPELERGNVAATYTYTRGYGKSQRSLYTSVARVGRGQSVPVSARQSSELAWTRKVARPGRRPSRGGRRTRFCVTYTSGGGPQSVPVSAPPSADGLAAPFSGRAVPDSAWITRLPMPAVDNLTRAAAVSYPILRTPRRLAPTSRAPVPHEAYLFLRGPWMRSTMKFRGAGPGSVPVSAAQQRPDGPPRGAPATRKRTHFCGATYRSQVNPRHGTHRWNAQGNRGERGGGTRRWNGDMRERRGGGMHHAEGPRRGWRAPERAAAPAARQGARGRKKTLPCRQGFLRSSYRRGASGWHRKPVLTAA